MKVYSVHCSSCKKKFYKTAQRFNEAKKFGWRMFCSQKCLAQSRNKRKSFTCSRIDCSKFFSRKPSQLKKSKELYCSRRCAAIINNSKYPKCPGVRKKCLCCGKIFVSRKKFCSAKCKFKGQIKPKEEILNLIRNFCKQNNLIPLKREITYYRAARGRFGTWNNAIIAAGFEPNPVMFAKKHIAKDGHRCDSLAERIIDDWLFARKIVHKRSVPYPGKKILTVDFVVKNYFVEFFGLYGEHRRYDELRKEKLKLARRYNLNLVKIYPKDIFPISKLSERFSYLVS